MMKKKWCVAALACATVLVQACSTNLRVHPLEAKSNAPARGAQYSLPFARYKVSVVRTLKRCIAGDSAELVFDVTVTGEQMFEPDPSQTFVIDTASLSNWLKTSELSWELYENGMLKSVGASAEDVTGQVIVGAVSIAAKIAQSILLPGSGLGLESVQPPPAADCTDDIKKALNKADDARALLKVARQELELEAARLKAMSDVITPFGEAPADRIQTRVVRQARTVAEKQIAQAMAQKKLEDAIDAISAVETFVWPRDGRRIAETRALSSTDFSEWVTGGKPFGDVELGLRIVPLNDVSIVNEGATHLPDSATGAQLDGIRYRSPVRGTLKVSLCRRLNASGQACAAKDLTEKNVAEGPVPQLGRLFVIPFWNGPFQKNTLNLTFSKDGSMATGKYAETAARGQVATDALNQAAGTLLTGLKDIKDLRVTRSQKELQDTKAQTELLVARKQLQDARGALQPSSTAENDKQKAILASDTELLNAQRAKIEAQLALEAARAGAQGGQ